MAEAAAHSSPKYMLVWVYLLVLTVAVFGVLKWAAGRLFHSRSSPGKD